MNGEGRRSSGLRILALCAGSYVSGMEIHALSLLTGLRDRGLDVRVVISCWNDGDFPSRLGERGLPFEPLCFGKLTRSRSREHVGWMWNTARRLPAALRGLRRTLRTFEPDAVLLFNRDTALLAAPLLARTPCVFHVAELAESTSWNRRLYRALDAYVDRWIGVSHFIGDRLPRLGVDAARVRVVYNGVPAAPARKRDPGADGGFTIGIAGQVGDWKGHGDLVEALGVLAARDVRPRCLVFGRGDAAYVEQLTRRAAALGVERQLEWRGFLRDADAIYAELDALVVPSRIEEAFGLVAAEAGMRAVPVIATRRGGLPEIVVDGVTGWLVDARRPDQIADRIAALLRGADRTRRR